MKQFVLWDPATKYPKNPAAIANLAVQTQRTHIRFLQLFQERVKANPILAKLNLADALLHHLSHMAEEARTPWCPASYFRALTSCMGAFSNLGKYALNWEGRIQLSAFPVWTSTLKTWDLLSKQTQPTHQAAATAEDIQTAVELEESPTVKCFLILLWLMAGRKGDVARLRTKNVTLHATGRLQVFVQEGKGVKARQGMYTVISHCPTIWFEELSRFLDSNVENTYLFPKSMGSSAEALMAIRVANPDLSLRAVRRGAAQALAKDSSVSEETIMKITGHRNVKTLHRYLGWDSINEKVHQATQNAAKNNLAPAPNPATAARSSATTTLSSTSAHSKNAAAQL